MSVVRRFIKELQRRQVFGVVVLYFIVAAALVEAADLGVIQDTFGVDPKLVLLAAMVGLPFAAVAGWLYDVTKAGIFRTPPSNADTDFDTRIRISDFGIIVAMLLVWASVVFILHKPPVTDRSIAILVFEDRSLDAEMQEFARELRDDIHMHLGRVATFTSIDPKSVDKINRSWTDTRIAGQLRVAYVLTGTVDRAGAYVTVSPRLVDGKDGSIVWLGDPIIREPTLDALYDMRTEIGIGVASALRKPLSVAENTALARRATASRAAHDAYRRGRELLLRREDDAIELAAHEFDKALEFDRRYAAAHAELAIALMLAADIGVHRGRGYEEARDLIDKALQIDPDLAEAHAAQGYLLWHAEKIDEALESLRRAIELDPTYETSYHWLASIYDSVRGEYDAAFRMTQELVERNPYDRKVFWNHVGSLIGRNRIEEAQQRIDDMRVIDPIGADWSQQDIDGLDGNWAQEVLWALDLSGEWPERMKYILTWGLVALDLEHEARRLAGGDDIELTLTVGGPEERQSIIGSLLNGNPDPDDPNNGGIGVALAVVGEYEASLPFLETWWRHWNRVISGDSVGITLRAHALIAAREHVEHTPKKQEVIEALKKNVARLREAGISANSRAHSVDYLEGITLYLDGRRGEGLALIARAAEDGFYLLPPDRFAFHKRLGREQAFQKLLGEQRTRQARERAEVLVVVCNDNPYADIWDPIDETCEAYR